MAEVIVLNGVAAGTVFVLGDVPAVVGRSPEAHLRIGDPWISSMHAMFEPREDGVWVVDLESRNGVFLGDERVAEARLAEGAVVRLGRTEIRFTLVHTIADGLTPLPTDTPAAPARRQTARTDGTLPDSRPVREQVADAPALALGAGTVLRMAIDAEGLELAAAPERIRAALDGAARAALEAGGVVARLAGVGVLAVFGLGGPAPDDAARAVRAARAARFAVRAEGGLELRAAIETGPVLAGNTAGASGFELTALGPAAERAERLLAFAARGEILAGPAAGTAAGLAPAGSVTIGATEVTLFRDVAE